MLEVIVLLSWKSINDVIITLFSHINTSLTTESCHPLRCLLSACLLIVSKLVHPTDEEHFAFIIWLLLCVGATCWALHRFLLWFESEGPTGGGPRPVNQITVRTVEAPSSPLLGSWSLCEWVQIIVTHQALSSANPCQNRQVKKYINHPLF